MKKIAKKAGKKSKSNKDLLKVKSAIKAGSASAESCMSSA